MTSIAWDDFADGAPLAKKTAVTIGVFDGVHIGHKALFARLRESGFPPLVITFKNHPRSALSPAAAPAPLMPLEERLRIFEEERIAYTVLIDFSPHFAIMDGEVFLRVVREKARAAYMVMGASFRCGYRGGLRAEDALRLNAAAGLLTEIAPPVMLGGLPVSSSRIRLALEAGDTALAELMLGRKV